MTNSQKASILPGQSGEGVLPLFCQARVGKECCLYSARPEWGRSVASILPGQSGEGVLMLPTIWLGNAVHTTCKKWMEHLDAQLQS